MDALKRKDVFHFIVAQHDVGWKKFPAPKCVYMDSYSDISDFLFVNRDEGWGFAVNYFDVDHNDAFKARFKNGGLLALDDLKAFYMNFFSMIRAKYGAVPILFLQMPLILEKRREYVARGEAVRQIIASIKNNFEPFYCFDVDKDSFINSSTQEVKQDDLYHFDPEAYEHFAKLVSETSVFNS